MTHKRARSMSSENEEIEHVAFSFDSASLRLGIPVPGATTNILEMLRNMSVCEKNMSDEGIPFHVSVHAIVSWYRYGRTPSNVVEEFGRDIYLDYHNAIWPSVVMHFDVSEKMSHTVSALFQGYLLYDKLSLSINRDKMTILSGSWLLQCVVSFVCGDCRMDLAEPVIGDDGRKIESILYEDLPRREKFIFDNTSLHCFCFSYLNDLNEKQFLKMNQDP